MSEPDEHGKAAVSTKQRRGLYDINEGFRGDMGRGQRNTAYSLVSAFHVRSSLYVPRKRE